jgi:hypothetical protein
MQNIFILLGSVVSRIKVGINNIFEWHARSGGNLIREELGQQDSLEHQ